MTTKSLIDIVFASERRKNVLLLLQEGPKETETLLRAMDTTRPALLPQIKILEESHLVKKDDNDICKLTTIGNLLVEEVRSLLETFVVLDEDISYWGTRNLDFIPPSMFYRIKELGSGKIWSPEVTDIYELNKDIIETTSISKSVISITSFLHPQFFHLFENLTEREIEVKMILTNDLFEKLKSEKYDQFKEVLEHDKTDFWLYPHDTALISFIQNEYANLFMILNRTGTFDHKQIIFSNQGALSWGSDLFRNYLDQSTRIIEM